ncbi:MAG: hypothetical protein KAI80_06640, partial [Hyphomicrobiaceae bacterium]|nr:hypothetical protein [Hyphomicrobiaceae bacterium]
VERGGRGKPSRVTVFCPTGGAAEPSEARQGEQQSEQQGEAHTEAQERPLDAGIFDNSAAASAAASAAGGKAVTAENLLRPESKPEMETRDIERASDPLPLPAWLQKWKRTNKYTGTDDALLTMVANGVQVITGRPATISPSKGYGQPVANAWLRLGYPETGDPEAEATHLSSSTGLGIVALLLDACKRCPHKYFRGDVRGFNEDGSTWKDSPHLTPAVVLRLDAKHGKGASIEMRLQAAREWDADGRPTVPDAEPLHEETAVATRQQRQTGPKTVAQMLAEMNLGGAK